MKTLRGIAIVSSVAATIGAVAVTANGRAETATPLTSATESSAMPMSLRTAIRERPRGVVLDCHRQSGTGGGLSQFRSRRNLVVGPLVMGGAASRPASSGGGNKFPVYVKGGHRVTVEVSGDARPGAGLVYGQGRFVGSLRFGYRVVTFIACERGEVSRGSGTTAWPVSFWAGGIRARSARCVPLRIWVDDEPSPRRAVVELGVDACA